MIISQDLEITFGICIWRLLLFLNETKDLSVPDNQRIKELK